jgi:hypothetical protein
MTRSLRSAAVLVVALVPLLGSAVSGEGSDNVVVVLDASGSMAEPLRGTGRSKMEVAKEAVIKVLSSVQEGTNVGVLVFSARNVETDLLYPLGPVERSRLEAAVRRVETGSRTPLGAYLKKGTDILLERRETQRGYGTFRLLVVTDGEASDPQLVARHLPDILSRGVTVDVIGVDMRADHSLATRVHSYRRANDPEALDRALAEVFAEVGASPDDPQDAEAFEVLAALPDEVAKAALAALVARAEADLPIGTSPEARAAAEGGPGGASPAPSPSPPGAGPGQAPGAGDGGGGGGDGGGGWLGPRTIVLVFLAAAAFAVLRGKRKGRRRER